MCRKETMPELFPYVNMTRENALWMAAQERLDAQRQREQRRRRNSERWNLK